MKGKPEILNTAISQMEAWRYSVISLEQLAGQYQKDTVIRSCEEIDEKSLQRCMVYAVRAGQSLAEVRTELEETFYIFGEHL